MFELPNLHLHVVIVCFALSLSLSPSIDKVLPRNRFILISGSKNFSLWMKQSTDEPFRADRSELLVLVVLSFEPILTSKKCRYTLRVCYGILSLPRMHTGLIWYWMETANILHGVASSL